MSEAARNLAPTESDRIIKWRQDRLRVAETEKAERVRKREEARALLEAERKKRRRETARVLLPQDGVLAEAEMALQKRRKSQNISISVQFLAVVVAPIMLAAWYLIAIATPLFEARAVVGISKAETAAEQNSGGILGAVRGPAHLQEVFMAHEFIQSQALMDKLETESSLVTALSGAQMDPVFRMRDLALLGYTERAQFNRFVESSVNIQTGLLTLYVRTPDANTSIATASRILDDTVAQINNLNDSIVGQRLRRAERNLQDAQGALAAAQAARIELQIRNGEVDPQRRISAIYDVIQILETQAIELANANQQATIAGVGGSDQAMQRAALEQHIRSQIEEQRAKLVVSAADGRSSLNAMLMDYEMANLRVQLAEGAVSTALVALAEAETSSALARSQIQVVVPPKTAEAPAFPRTVPTLLIIATLSLSCFVLLRLIMGGRRPAF